VAIIWGNNTQIFKDWEKIRRNNLSQSLANWEKIRRNNFTPICRLFFLIFTLLY